MQNKNKNINSYKTENKIELLSPAPDFQSGLIALKSGADAIYAGAKKFSARKSATNFTLQELGRIKSYALSANKKIYITLNTIIKNSEYDEIFHLLRDLNDIEINGIIIQDLGLGQFVQRNFPLLELHASTQMGIHNCSGLDIIQELKNNNILNIKRVVLPRELTLDEIKEMRNKHPELELEVFIHGALCYSFSGMCLASGLILNRSGNRGACAQLCRSYYNIDNDHKYYFSCKDLTLGNHILDLKRIGIHSLKIEGRMKSKEYIESTVRFYREILDNDKLTDDKYKELLNASSLSFSRKKTIGFLDNHQGKDLIDNLCSNHQGVLLGEVLSINSKVIDIKLKHQLSVGNSLMFIKNGINVVRFQAFHFSDTKKKTVLKEATVNTIVSITLPNYDLPNIGDQIYLIQTSNSEMMDIIDYKNLEIFKHKCRTSCILEKIQDDFFLSLQIISDKTNYIYKQKIIADEAKKESNFLEIFQGHFNQSGDELYVFELTNLDNKTNLKNIFVPPKEIKQFKNNAYQSFKEYLNTLKYIPAVVRQCDIKNDLRDNIRNEIKNNIKLTKFLQTRRNLANSQLGPIPFFSLTNESDLLASYQEDGITYKFLPLFPIIKSGFINNEKTYIEKITNIIQSEMTSSPNSRIFLGINNLSHLKIVQELKQFPYVFYFIDFYAYTASNETISFWKNNIPNLAFIYNWVEDEAQVTDSEIPTISIHDKKSLPLFVALGCFHKHNFKNSNQSSNKGSANQCSHNCKKSFNYSLINGKNKYKVIVDNCISWLFHE